MTLDIYGGTEPVAAIVDNGHGMSRREFEGRWLVVGTESKVTADDTPQADRNGLAARPRQGQKGIGRLSCANLGPVLLLVSKRATSPFVAALIDWRLFENPFLNLSDIQIPVTEFDQKEQLFDFLPQLIEGLASNVTGDTDDEARMSRLRAAWRSFDQLFEQEQAEGISSRIISPSEALLSTVRRIAFTPKHLSTWPLWNEESDRGTALLVAEINYDLLVELDDTRTDSSAQAARDRFFETLTSFIDPFYDPTEGQTAAERLDFTCAVRTWVGPTARTVVGPEKQFDRHTLDAMEHLLQGSFDHDGVFKGKVKAFGAWVPEPCVIEPPTDLDIPKRADSAVGPLDLYIATMEFRQENSSLTSSEFEFFDGLAKKYSGFMVFRDNLRVLPYGREDNDFFEIESRRSKNAGREFWNHRQMFGRLAISRERNPNLKDKAGR